MNRKKREAKVAFWKKVKDNPLVDSSNLSDQEAADLIRQPELTIWLRDDEYRSWFYDEDTLDKLLAIGAEASLSRLIAIVNETNVGPRETVSSSSQVAAAKALLEYFLSKPSPQEAKVSAEDLPNDEKALREYIERNAKKLRVLSGSGND